MREAQRKDEFNESVSYLCVVSGRQGIFAVCIGIKLSFLGTTVQ